MNANINLNQTTTTLEACVKETTNWGENLFTNICTGQVVEVEWGTVEYLIAMLLFPALGVMVAAVIGGFLMILRDSLR